MTHAGNTLSRTGEAPRLFTQGATDETLRGNKGGDKMTPPTYTGVYRPPSNSEAAMLAQSGKRLTTRITDHVQVKLQAAADLVGATLNQFVVQAALEKAEKVIESESTIVLTRRESVRLLEMIENPPPRNERFKKLMTDHERENEDGSNSSIKWSPR